MVQSRTSTTADTAAWESNKYAKCIDDAIEAASQELRSLSLKVGFELRSGRSTISVSPPSISFSSDRSIASVALSLSRPVFIFLL